MRITLGDKVAFLLLLLAAAIPMMMACGRDAVPTLTSVPEPGSITIYAGRSEKLIAPIIQQFSDASGIGVSVKYGKTASLAATLLEEGDNSPADVFYAQDPGGIGSVENLLSPLPKDTLNRVPEWARSPDLNWVGISGRARVVVYNSDELTEAELPGDLWGFVEPQWKDRIGWPPTNSSFQTMITGLRSVWGEEKTREWLEGIQANSPTIYAQNTPTVAATGSGEVSVGFVNHYYLYRFLLEEGDDFPARNYHLRDGGAGALVMVSGAGILGTSKNKRDAKKFINFLLSKPAQQYFAQKTYEYPLIEGVDVHPLLTSLGDIKKPAIPLRELSDLDGTQNLLRQTGVLP
ncbi:iron ABC transporter substrate-binding protein [SAR202 cluster bacterium AD-804-J14_MRT_500m]|nr:iron ABC transporter substrate-binding protein [SAR202 cluster bacterium AD-804-J14_MRT_500m]